MCCCFNRRYVSFSGWGKDTGEGTGRKNQSGNGGGDSYFDSVPAELRVQQLNLPRGLTTG